MLILRLTVRQRAAMLLREQSLRPDAEAICAHRQEALCVGRTRQATGGHYGFDLGTRETIQSCPRGRTWPSANGLDGRSPPSADRGADVGAAWAPTTPDSMVAAGSSCGLRSAVHGFRRGARRAGAFPEKGLMNSTPPRRRPSCISSLITAEQPIRRAAAQIIASQNES